jgi:hypothetical protein
MDVRIFQGPGPTPAEFATGANQFTLIVQIFPPVANPQGLTAQKPI